MSNFFNRLSIEPPILITFLLLYGVCNAQTNAVVIDSLSNKPIPQVNIWLTCKGQGTFSDEKGFFSFKKTFGAEKVILSAVGYETKRIS
ncbi:carboxypeptidase-like regulatory domain-containing protein [Maribacter sp. 2210JD10-5]|uniref:carboxypeptidase-like regulatory domain-containing protein n=1 Tax=Maribacter sp. 2210JD10-5 TaxID=3386272 RepID=UPI0039BD19EA